MSSLAADQPTGQPADQPADRSEPVAADLAFFSREGETFVPQPVACSMWSADQMHGVAVSGLLARGLEAHAARAGAAGLVPARYRVDLFRAARMSPSAVAVATVRQAPRLLLLDAELHQGGVTVARASATFLRPAGPTTGRVWSATDRATPPPAEIAPETDAPHVPFFESDAPWSDDFSAHQNGGRHTTWQTPVPIVAGEPATPFQAVAAIADGTSMVTNWGSAGVEYINTDICLALSRLPVGVEVGLRALDHVAHDGISTGVAEVFDRHGTLGTSTVTALANTRRTVDLSGFGR